MCDVHKIYVYNESYWGEVGGIGYCECMVYEFVTITESSKFPYIVILTV